MLTVRVCILFIAYLSSTTLAASLYGLFDDVGALSPVDDTTVQRFTSAKRNGGGIRYVPRSGLMIGGRGYMPGFVDMSRGAFEMRKRRSPAPDGMFTEKRANRNPLDYVPRSGLMIGGRGYMPGFADMPRASFDFRKKRNVQVSPVDETLQSARNSIAIPQNLLSAIYMQPRHLHKRSLPLPDDDFNTVYEVYVI